MNKYVVDFIFLPLIGAFHGYLTNKVAIWLLFNPKEPIRIPIIKYDIQGVLPKRKAAIADSLADVVENELFSQNDIKKFFQENKIFIKSIPMIHQHIMDRIEEQLPKWIPIVIRRSIMDYLSNVMMKELFSLFKQFGDYIEEVQTALPIKDIVKDKILKLNFAELELLVRKVAKKELSFIEWLGFYMGLGIGLIQGIFLIAIGH
ncbi:DUF445 family protein [Aceticella autotrophica]|uniref:DUF445 family protein n=1 Tax=Aceticella autotrophica TaxID=2755338 RepID=A0A975ATX1_9THEO|nr:DUF445 family protein [Aceticella autotrophica]QSZ26489.1 DUF445 family protein [Aceticella autotrophica]